MPLVIFLLVCRCQKYEKYAIALLRVVPTVTLFFIVSDHIWKNIFLIWHIFSDLLFWHSIWHSILTFFSGIMSDIHSILTPYLASILTFSLAFILVFFLIFYLASILTFFLASILAFFLACILAFTWAFFPTFYSGKISFEMGPRVERASFWRGEEEKRGWGGEEEEGGGSDSDKI